MFSFENRVLEEAQFDKLSSVYNLSSCEIFTSIHPQRLTTRRQDHLLPTKDCDVQQVNNLSVEYSRCITVANHDMSRDIISQNSVADIFKVLCQGIEKIVHNCSQTLDHCYTPEEIVETKVGQLKLTKKVN